MIGYYSDKTTQINEFGMFTDPSGVKLYVDNIIQKKTNAILSRGLNALASRDYSQDPGPPITAIFFVSSMTSADLDDAKAAAKLVQNQGIHLVLVAHGADPALLEKVTGDKSSVFSWKLNQPEPDNSADWLSRVMNCQNFQIEDAPLYPCPGKIIIAYDSSQALSESNFKKERSFVRNKVFSKWTDFERLALSSYAYYPNSQGYGAFQSLDDVQGFIDQYGQVGYEKIAKNLLNIGFTFLYFKNSI
jgi:hypothetical protein